MQVEHLHTWRLHGASARKGANDVKNAEAEEMKPSVSHLGGWWKGPPQQLVASILWSKGGP